MLLAAHFGVFGEAIRWPEESGLEQRLACGARDGLVSLEDLERPLWLNLRHRKSLHRCADLLGTQVNRAARIEPLTPPGVVYVSEAFAAPSALSRNANHKVEYAGLIRLAKKFGELAVFRLHQG